MKTGPAPATPRPASSRARSSPSSVTSHRRWRTPSSSVTSARVGRVATSARIGGRPAGRVLVQADDGRRVDARGAQQPVAVLLGARQGPLVRQDPAVGPERLDPEPGEEAALCPLDVRVRARGTSARTRRRRGAGPCAGCRPSARRPASVATRRYLSSGSSSCASAAGRSSRTAFLGWRARSSRWRSAPITSYGGATTGAEAAGDLGVEPEGAEGADLGHGVLEGAGRRRAGRGATRADLGLPHRTIGAVGRPPGTRPAADTGGPRATFPPSGASLLRPHRHCWSSRAPSPVTPDPDRPPPRRLGARPARPAADGGARRGGRRRAASR